MALHKGMHAALHRDVSPHTGKFDNVGCSRLRQRRAMKHNEDMLVVPFIDLKIMGHRIQVRHGYRMMIAYDRYERHKLADVCFEFGLFKDKRFASPNSLNHDHNILEPASLADHDLAQQAIAQAIGECPAEGGIRSPVEVETLCRRDLPGKRDCSCHCAPIRYRCHVIGGTLSDP